MVHNDDAANTGRMTMETKCCGSQSTNTTDMRAALGVNYVCTIFVDMRLFCLSFLVLAHNKVLDLAIQQLNVIV